jgi:hypothetical protein
VPKVVKETALRTPREQVACSSKATDKAAWRSVRASLPVGALVVARQGFAAGQQRGGARALAQMAAGAVGQLAVARWQSPLTAVDRLVAARAGPLSPLCHLARRAGASSSGRFGHAAGFQGERPTVATLRAWLPRRKRASGNGSRMKPSSGSDNQRKRLEGLTLLLPVSGQIYTMKSAQPVLPGVVPMGD